MTRPDVSCRRCGTPLVETWRSRMVDATERFAQSTTDGTTQASILAATSACSWNCLAVLAAQLAGPDADAAVRIVAERERQVTAEGYTPEGDTDQPPGVLAAAGVAYVWNHATQLAGPAFEVGDPPDCWPFDPDAWNPKDRLGDLIRAGALVAAEADRDVRAARAREPF